MILFFYSHTMGNNKLQKNSSLHKGNNHLILYVKTACISQRNLHSVSRVHILLICHVSSNIITNLPILIMKIPFKYLFSILYFLLETQVFL